MAMFVTGAAVAMSSLILVGLCIAWREFNE